MPDIKYFKSKKEYLKWYKNYRQKNAKKLKKYIKSYRKKYRKKHGMLKDRARSRVGSAVKSGKLLKRKCKFCKNNKVEGHHKDYNKPLEVIWLCRKHHSRIHRELLTPTFKRI